MLVWLLEPNIFLYRHLAMERQMTRSIARKRNEDISSFISRHDVGVLSLKMLARYINKSGN